MTELLEVYLELANGTEVLVPVREPRRRIVDFRQKGSRKIYESEVCGRPTGMFLAGDEGGLMRELKRNLRLHYLSNEMIC